MIQRFSKSDNISEDMRVFGEGLDMESVAYAEFICEVEDEWDVELELDELGPVDQTVGQLTDRILGQIGGQ
jgi:acyl carrier protein